MPVNLRDRNFLKELDFTPAEWRFLLDRAADLKRAKRDGSERPRLTGKNFALVFEKVREVQLSFGVVHVHACCAVKIPARLVE